MGCSLVEPCEASPVDNLGKQTLASASSRSAASCTSPMMSDHDVTATLNSQLIATLGAVKALIEPLVPNGGKLDNVGDKQVRRTAQTPDIAI